MATVFNNNILLSGDGDSCVYMYNDLVYVNILALPFDKYKVLCDKWILSDGVLYENKKRNM